MADPTNGRRDVVPAAKKPQKTEKVPAREAAKVVLMQAGRPMHYREITKVALEQGIIRVRGGSRKKPDPDKTMRTIRSYLCEAEGKEFVRIDTGVFDLKERVEKATKAAKKRAAAKPKADA